MSVVADDIMDTLQYVLPEAPTIDRPNSDDQPQRSTGAHELSLRSVLQTSLGKTYTLERELSGSGMSRVFLAAETALGRKVVMKVVGRARSHQIVDQFGEEIRLSAALQQANIIPVLSAGTAAGLPWYTMPLVEERSLLDRLKREGALPIPDAIGILRDVARALAFAHAHGVVHRDIKPGNVLLSGGAAIVADFGIARSMGAAAFDEGADPSQAVLGSGTPEYMAPEQAMGDPSADHRVDIYAFGCLAYAVFTGKPPFAKALLHQTLMAHLREMPPPLSVLRPDVPQRIAALVASCLQKDPARRPQHASELLEELEPRVETTTAGPTVSPHTLIVAMCCAATLALLALVL